MTLFYLLFLGFCLINSDNSKLGMRIIDIVMATNNKFVHTTFVAMTSLLKNADPNTFYQINVLIPGKFKTQSRSKIDTLKEKYNNCRIDFINMGDKYKNISTKKFPAPTYYRLQVGSLFSKRKKCIYLDGDIIVRHDLSEMYDIEIEEYYIAGVCHGEAVPRRSYHKVLKIPDLNQYVCAGVLVMNLENIRKNNLEERFLKLLDTRTKNMKKFMNMYADQDIINPICYGKIFCLHPKFDFLINLYLRRNSTQVVWNFEDPVIVHFAGMEKPWTHPNLSIFHEEYWRYDLKKF